MGRTEHDWLRGGLRFTCEACGRCCTGIDGRDTVYVNRHERRAIARYLGLDGREFARRFTVVNEDGDRVLGARGASCIFLVGNRCEIYQVRPVQCRTWPFWPENLVDEAAWHAVCAECPGAGRGELRGASVVARCLLAVIGAGWGKARALSEVPDLSAPVAAGACRAGASRG